MPPPKVHMDYAFVTACGLGWQAVEMTKADADVTCKNCLRIMAADPHQKPCRICRGTGKVSRSLQGMSGTIRM